MTWFWRAVFLGIISLIALLDDLRSTAWFLLGIGYLICYLLYAEDKEANK